MVEQRPYKAQIRGSIPLPHTRLNWRRHFGGEWGQWLGHDECPYARRWMIKCGFFSLRIHHFIKGDDPRYLHDHAWWFLTFVFKGGYTDVGEKSRDHLRAPALRFRRANHRHTVATDPGGAWTFLVTGPSTRNWGFYVKGKFMKANKFFRQVGLHPCDD
jgi:hypothetical protein